MCGIYYVRNLEGKPASKLIRTGYYNQKERGTDGFGFIAIKNGKMDFHRTKHEHQIMRELKHTDAPEIMFHHRFPTSTENTVQTAHPIMARRGKIYKNNWYLVHNGMIFNHAKLFAEHKSRGIVYATEHLADTTRSIYNYEQKTSIEKTVKYNDSECLLHELALNIEGHKTMEEFDISGSLAFILLQTDKKEKPVSLYFGRNGSPLRMHWDTVNKKQIILSSSGPGADIPINTLFRYDYGTNGLEIVKMLFDTYDYSNLDDVKYIDDTFTESTTDITEMNDDLPPFDGIDIFSLVDMTTSQLFETERKIIEKRTELYTRLGKSQRKEDYDEEQKYQSGIDIMEEYLEAVRKEINRKDLKF